MLKRELKVNFKNFLIWLLILIGVFLLVYCVYPSILSSEMMNQMNDMMKMFPEELLKAFNMDISSIDTVFGWIKTEGWVFVLLLMGIYSAMLGANILLKEENDKTVEYITSLPIKRSQIVTNKIISGVIYIMAMNVLFTLFNYVALSISGEFDTLTFICLSITPVLTSLVIFSLCLWISTFFRKTRKMVGISLAIVFISYFLNMLSGISESVKFLQYASIFTLADIRNVILNNSINPTMVVVSIGITVLCLLLTYIGYQRKEFV